MRRLISAGFATASAVGLAVVVAPGTAAAAPQILGIDSPTAIDNSYIVVYKDSAAAEAKSTAKSLGSKVDYTYEAAFDGFAASISEEQAKQFAADPDVAFVQQNQVVSIQTDQPNPPSWGLDRIDQRNLPLNSNYSYTTGAANVHAYIIDTGIDLDHPGLGGRVTAGLDAIDNDMVPEDGHGHGTHVAGTVGGTAYGVAKDVQLVAVRVLGNTGSGTSAQVAAGVNWVTQNAIKPAVANMSLGINANDTTINTAVANSIADGGITYAIASGNSNANACNFSPARVPAAITVNATGTNDARASFSNFGNCTDIFAPGVDITSTWRAGGTNTISGTSMATPHVAGAAALYLADNPAATPEQVQAALIAASTPNVVTSPGTGSFNRLLFTGEGTTEPPPPSCAAATNANNYTINDNATVNSPLTISGCTAAPLATSTVALSIVHTYRGDLIVDLVAPDGSVYNLHNRGGGSADNLSGTYTVNLSSETANGTWNLRVRDMASADTGYIDTWTLDM